MENFTLQQNETVLYKGEGYFVSKKESLSVTISTELLLTNLNLVFINKTKKIFAKEQVDVEVYPIEEIKIYNEIPQIKQKNNHVEIYLTSGEKSLSLLSKYEAIKFTNIAYELLTGKSMSVRGAEKVKGAVNLVDDTLGIDTVNTVKNVIEKGVAGTILGGLGKKVSAATKGSSTVKETITATRNILGINSTRGIESKSEINTVTSYEAQVETIKKMKELLDAGVLTQEEFDIKKKEILGL